MRSELGACQVQHTLAIWKNEAVISSLVALNYPLEFDIE